jgi:hypothetical protein
MAGGDPEESGDEPGDRPDGHDGGNGCDDEPGESESESALGVGRKGERHEEECRGAVLERAVRTGVQMEGCYTHMALSHRIQR